MQNFTEEADGTVTLRLTQEDWQQILVLTGIALGSAPSVFAARSVFALLNRINQGNSRFQPYSLDSPPSPTDIALNG